MTLSRTLGLLLCTVATAAFGASPAIPVSQTLIQNVAVFDGVRNTGRHAVLIAGSKIADTDYHGKASPTMHVVDGRGKTLLPGLIDSHVHAFQGQDDALLFGVTTQLDMFSAPASTRDVRDRMARGDNATMADIYTSGILATVPKGHGTEYGFAIPTLTRPDEADAWVAARVAEGSDYIKIIDEPGTTFGRLIPTLDVPTIRALIVAAHKHGKLAVVHVQSLATATDVVNAGADGLAHLFTDTDGGAAFAKLAKSHRVFIVPTYTVFEGFSGRAGSATLLDRPALAGLLPRAAVDTLRQSFGTDRSAKLDATEAANLSALVREGVPILAGTDAGNPGTWYGVSLHRELDLLVKGGLSPVQALSAATANPAKAFRLSDRGRIAKGFKADLVLVNGDPTASIAAVHDIVEIWKDGQLASPLRAARRTALRNLPATVLAPVALPADGRIVRFGSAGGKPVMQAPFGAGWATSTDSIFGGSSTVAISAGGTAPSGQAALVMTGAIKPGFIAPWAGIAFSPAAQQFQPANLGLAKAMRFWAHGEGKSFAVMGFSRSGGQRPSVVPFVVGKDWTEITVRFADLSGFDPANATLLLIGATQQDGPFRLEIADVRLVKE